MKMPALSIHRLIAVLCLAAPSQGCCGDPGSTRVDPNCPRGVPASSSLAVMLAPAAIRPIGSPKQIRVRGNRLDTSPCIESGAQSSFSTELREPSPLTTNQATLAPGAWKFTITALSGGDYDSIEIAHALSPGAAATMNIAGDASQNIVVTF